MEHPQKKVVDPATRELIDRLFVECISLAGIARAVQVSEQWLQTYVNQKYAKVCRSRASGTQKKGETDDAVRRVMVFCGQQIWNFLAMTPFLKQLIQHNFKLNNSFVKLNPEDIEQSIPERFQQQVRQYGDRLAIKTTEHQFTYHTLNQLANRIARTILNQQGEGAEPIALLFSNGAPIIAAMLSVLKAGKFYIPIDTSQPQARITYILQDSQAKLLLTDNTQIELAKELSQQGLEIINIDDINSQESSDNLDIIISPESLAYIIYTSGSTGQPKGVMQNHRYVLNLTKNYTNSGYLSIEYRFAILYSPGFGGAVRDIYCALLNGAALFPFDVKLFGLTQLGHWLNEQKITIFFAVATMFRHFAQSLTADEQFPHLRQIQIGSETVYQKDVQLYQQHFSDECILVVNLGGTEISPICQFFVDKKTKVESSTVPAGYAVEGVDILLLDDLGQPVGKNEVGEIVVKSPYLSVGYWRKPEITQAVFLPDPDGGDKRLYKTGDLGCMLPDGCLLHLGRKDFQVKVRGYRIDVSEVEMALLNTNLIREAAVVTSPDRLGEQGLKAYIVPIAPQQALSLRELRSLLLENLPDYMVPSTFTILEALPLTPHGKVDRLSLPAFSQVQRAQLESLVLPRTPTEEILVDIWTQVLGVEEIGIHDNFFELGGHSLLVNELMVQLSNAFSIKIPFITVFELPTIAQLAKRIENTCWITSIQKNELDDSTNDFEGGTL